MKYYQDVLKTGGGLAGVRERLAAHGGWRKAYFGHLRRALAWVDKGLGPSAWSADSYEFTLTMAFIYPFASLFIVWGVTGQNTSGISALLPEDTGALLAQNAFYLLALFCQRAFLVSLTRKAPGWQTLVSYITAMAFTRFLGASVLAPSVAVAAVFAVAVSEGAVAVAFAFAFALGISSAVLIGASLPPF